MERPGPIRVAVVGSGLAGLTTAYLLNRDPRYTCTVFEAGAQLSLDSASRTVKNVSTGEEERIDVPMRAIAGGYYRNLMRMYDYLGIRYDAQPFLFSFSRLSSGSERGEHMRDDPYFIHASNHHRIPPVRPAGTGLLQHIFRLLYLVVCYLWFAICSFIVAPRCDNGKSETFNQYLQRIRLPTHFVRYYVLPLFASVATCTHHQLLDFPASDLTDYKKRSHGAQHFTVKDGVRSVQEKLADGLDVRLDSKVVVIEPQPSGRVAVRWIIAGTSTVYDEERFDRVVLAVSPDVVARIFEPLRSRLSCIPTISVTSVLHRPVESIPPTGRNDHVIALRTTETADVRTEAAHLQPSGVVVTTGPLSPIDSDTILQVSRFTRVLRTAESRQVLQQIFREDARNNSYPIEKPGWTNGDQNVWLAGGWCWDGMVLLEGCVVSAVRVAQDLGVEVPWRRRSNTLRQLLMIFRPSTAMALGFVVACIASLFVLSAGLLSSGAMPRVDLPSLLVGILAMPLAKHLLHRLFTSNITTDVYGLDHGRLNLTLPPTSMWMNMGYWKDTDDFPTACQALLKLVLDHAGLSNESRVGYRNRTIIDVGIGCGDQALTVAPLADNYIGITNNRTQYAYAHERLTQAEKVRTVQLPAELAIICADAAQPRAWPADLQQGMRRATGFRRETWLVALDCLYHFQPSREPIFKHAYTDWNASIAAFDLFLADDASVLNRTLLSILARLMSAPPSNFVTVKQYRAQLVAAGYNDDDIEITDISEHVFGGLAGFLERQERALSIIGLGVGPYKAARWMFRWWATGGVVRGCVVVARN